MAEKDITRSDSFCNTLLGELIEMIGRDSSVIFFVDVTLANSIQSGCLEDSITSLDIFGTKGPNSGEQHSSLSFESPS